MMKRCMLRGTKVRCCKSVIEIISITRRQYSTWFIEVLNTGLRPHLVVSEIIAIAEPLVSGSVLWKLGLSSLSARMKKIRSKCLC